jgi:hypothetical protein
MAGQRSPDSLHRLAGPLCRQENPLRIRVVVATAANGIPQVSLGGVLASALKELSAP